MRNDGPSHHNRMRPYHKALYDPIPSADLLIIECQAAFLFLHAGTNCCIGNIDRLSMDRWLSTEEASCAIGQALVGTNKIASSFRLLEKNVS